MQICAACGGENPEGFRHCGHCGAPLAAPAAERRKLATLVFCDVAGSTALGERLDAEAVRGLMLAYFAEAREVLERHGGTVEKFIGDAVVAAFGVPEAHEDDALRACRAALEIQERLAGRIALRIGVNTGEVVTGDASARQAFMSGDAVNVAARLEQAAPPGEVLVGAPTYRLVRGAVTVEPVEPLAAKGKSEPVAAYRLLAVSGAGPVPRRAATALVGREGELELLEREFDAAVAEGRCRLVTVVGEPGVGKSRLAAELVARVEARAARGGCLSYGEGITYWAVGQIVRELAGIRDEHSPEEARAQLLGVVAGVEDGEVIAMEIAQLLGLSEGSTTAEEMAWAVRQLLAAAAREEPLLVFVDDIHWAEPALLELLVLLPARIRDAPILVVCLARPELHERSPDWPVTLRLEPLAGAELEDLLTGLGAPDAVRAQLARASAGNPLFAEELVAMLVDDGVLREDDGRWVLERPLDEVALPASVNALLGARLDRLETRARDALERGSIEGEVFHGGAVVELSAPEARTDVPEQLDGLEQRDFVRPASPTLAGETAFRFKHILVREAAYRGTAKKLRAALHEQFASWLERLAGERVAEYREILGHHLEQSYLYRAELGVADDEIRTLGERAAEQFAIASDRAVARGDYHAAAGLLERALAVGLRDPLRRAQRQLELASHVGLLGRVADKAALSEDVLETALGLGDRALAARARVRRAETMTWHGERNEPEQRRIAEEAIATLTELGDQRGLGEAWQFYGQSHGARERGERLSVFYERALAAALAAGDDDRLRGIVHSIAFALWSDSTPVADGIPRCEELLRLRPDDRAGGAMVGRSLAALLAMAGRAEEALELADRSGRVLDELGLADATQVAAAEAREYAGDRAGAIADLQANWAMFEGLRPGGQDVRAIRAAYRLAMLQCDEGRWDEAERCIAYGAEVYDRLREPGELWPLRYGVEARLAAHHGRHEEAVALARKALDLELPLDRPNLWGRVWEAVAEVQRAAGNAVEADAAVVRALASYEQKGNVAAIDRLRATAAP